MEWTDETIARLRALWADGHSTAEIGRRIGISKNAVVGKAHRLTLPPRPSPIRRDGMSCLMPRSAAAPRVIGSTLPPLSTEPSPPPLAVRSRDEPEPREPVVIAAAPEVVARPVERAPVAEPRPAPPPPPVLVVAPPRRVRTVACCWPLGDPGTKTFRFCDAEAASGKPYCAEHAALAYVKVRDRREDSAEQPSYVARLAR